MFKNANNESVCDAQDTPSGLTNETSLGANILAASAALTGSDAGGSEPTEGETSAVGSMRGEHQQQSTASTSSVKTSKEVPAEPVSAGLGEPSLVTTVPAESAMVTSGSTAGSAQVHGSCCWNGDMTSGSTNPPEPPTAGPIFASATAPPDGMFAFPAARLPAVPGFAPYQFSPAAYWQYPTQLDIGMNLRGTTQGLHGSNMVTMMMFCMPVLVPLPSPWFAQSSTFATASMISADSALTATSTLPSAAPPAQLPVIVESMKSSRDLKASSPPDPRASAPPPDPRASAPNHRLRPQSVIAPAVGPISRRPAPSLRVRRSIRSGQTVRIPAPSSAAFRP